MVEPGLGHHDRRKHVRDNLRIQAVSLADAVVTGPLGDYLPVCDRAHGLGRNSSDLRVHYRALATIERRPVLVVASQPATGESIVRDLRPV